MAGNQGFAGTRDSLRERLDRLDSLSRLLDIAFTVPGTNIRFGAESIMRLVPGIGDAAASALSCLILYEAHRLGVSRRVMIRMAGNVAIEAVAGAVPVVGDLFDVAFRANRRNVRILREHFGIEIAGQARDQNI
jgi:C4-dicarboxylate transporter